jgi:transketolase
VAGVDKLDEIYGLWDDIGEHEFYHPKNIAEKEIIENKGLSVGIVNMRSLNPIDEEAILDLTKNTSNLVIVEDHFHVGGLYSIVSEILTKNQKTMPIIPINMGKRWFKPGLLSEVLEYEGFTGKKIAEKVLTNI